MNTDKYRISEVCVWITKNLENAKQLRLKLKWGFTKEGETFGKILNQKGMVVFEEYYSEGHVISHIGRIHWDFGVALEDYRMKRKSDISRRWSVRKNERQVQQSKKRFEQEREAIRRKAYDEQGVNSPFPYKDYLQKQ